MAADEEIAGHEIAGESVNPTPILPPTTDPADTCDAYAEVEYAGECVPDDPVMPDLTIDGDTCDAYAEVEYAGECVDINAVFPSLPSSTVEEFDTTRGRLGCGTPLVFVTTRCSGSMVCQFDLSDITGIIWTRRLDEVSEAEVEIGLTGDASQTCCACLASLEPWCHELHIWRDAEEVWVGPIEAIRYERDKVTIKAKDVLGWLDVRIPNEDVDFTAATGSGAADLTDIAYYIITTAFEEDVINGFECEVNNIHQTPTGEVVEWFAEGFNETALEVLVNLAETELNFTCIGRTIVISGDSSSLSPLTLLNDEHIMGEIEITKDGKAQGNRYYVHYEGDGGIPAIGQAADFYCYSLIERIADGSGLQLLADAEAVADTYVASSAITPRVVDIPSGSKLSPDTPWTINQMVPGARVDVAVTRLCLQLTQSFLLVGVTAEYTAGDGEAIGIELTPLNSTATL